MVCCLLFAVCVAPVSLTVNYIPPSCVRYRINQPTTHDAAFIPRKPLLHQPHADPLDTFLILFSHPSCVSPTHSLARSLLPLPPLHLPLPRRPQQLILHLGHLLVLDTERNAPLLLLENPRHPRQDILQLFLREALIRLSQKVNQPGQTKTRYS